MEQPGKEGVPTILILDDEESILASLRSVLRREGYDLKLFSSGEKALEFLHSDPVDIIVSDMRMPIMTGVEFLNRASALAPNATRIMLSAFEDKHIVLESVSRGLVHHYILKPWEDEDFRALLRNALVVNREVGESDLKKVIASVQGLPVPNVFSEKLRLLLEKGESSLGDIAGEVEKHPSMVAKILKIANSVHFATRNPIVTVSEAIFFIGVEQISALSVGLESFASVSHAMDPQHQHIVDDLWNRSLRRALLARSIARSRSAFEDHNLVYIAALLLDIGYVLRLCKQPREYLGYLHLVKENGTPSFDAEKEIFGVTHDIVGKVLLDYWNIPAPIGDAVGRHHGETRGETVMQIIQMADILEGHGEASGPHDPSVGRLVDEWRANTEGGTRQEEAPAVSVSVQERSFEPNKKVLFVDDEEKILQAFKSLLRKEDLRIFTLNDSQRIQEMCDTEGPFAVVLSDQRMPVYDGVKVLEIVKASSPDTVRVMVTGYSDPKDTARAINLAGITYFISKPWVDAEMKRNLVDWVAKYNLSLENRHLVDELKQKNESLREILEGTVSQTTRILSDMVAYVSPEAAGQVDRLRKLGTAIVKTIPNVSGREKWEIMRAIDLHNLGLVTLPAWILVTLNKDGLRAIDRFVAARNHYLQAAELLKNIPRFEGVAQIIKFMHKDFDGNGPPAEFKCVGMELPLGARLLHILLDLESQSTERFFGRAVLEQMMKRPEKYDVALIQRILGTGAPAKLTIEERELTIEEMEPGMVLMDDVRSNKNDLLIRARTILTQTSINILLQWQAGDRIDKRFKVRAQV
jgi:response regulator RpfG family c-di-GMP phosphodiesterase